MKISDIIGAIGIFLVGLIFIALIVVVIYNGVNMEYKYTADVNCYDKHDSMIEGVMCKHEVYCGPWQKSTPFRKEHLLCNNDVNVGNSVAGGGQ